MELIRSREIARRSGRSTHRGAIRITVTILTLLAAANLVETKPNVVLLLADDLGWKDSGCYDGPVKSPAIDGLAANGVRFTDFHSVAAICSGI